jgi:hypothetical protein
MGDNLALWKSVERTPKEHTKSITGKAYKGTSPKPHYLVMKATETFGPCGIGWGFKIASERIEDGSDGVKVHIARIAVWYKWNGETGHVEHVGQTVFSGKNRNGPFTDEDAPKKSVTDGLVKALSMIGFAGDIFMGRYDDSKYIAELEADLPASQQSAQPKAKETPAQEYVRVAKDVVGRFANAGNLGGWWKDEAPHRTEAGVVKGSPEYDELFYFVKEMGEALAQKEAAE